MRADGPLVAVIDDDEATCRAVARFLGSEGYRVRTYNTAREYLDEADLSSPACVLVDIRMPGLDGLDLIRTMRDGGGDVPAVFMTATGDIPTVVEAMKEGALDLLAKPFSAEMLSTAIAAASDSGRQVRGAREALIDVWRRLERLTPREAEVCALVACGLLNKRVAARIGTKEKTVKVHRGRVMQKLHMTSLAELIRLVDAVQAERSRHSIKLDGVDVARPRTVDIIIDILSHARDTGPTVVAESVDQRTMPRA
ncbi:MAG: response regulator transcription factor [Gemmatimonadaceae bacterium]